MMTTDSNNNSLKHVLAIVFSGIAGGITAWLLVTPDVPALDREDVYHLARLCFLGGVAAGVGVYFFPAADLRNFTRCIFFALVCGIGSEAVIGGASSMLEQIQSKDEAREAAAATKSLDQAIKQQPLDFTVVETSASKLISLLPLVKDQNTLKVGEESLDDTLAVLKSVPADREGQASLVLSTLFQVAESSKNPSALGRVAAAQDYLEKLKWFAAVPPEGGG